MSESTALAVDDHMIARLRELLGGRSLVLVGLMGAGKTSIGKRLAARLDLPFVDADTAIEEAAGMSIPEIFERDGEAYFREGEKRVIARLLREGQQVLATGGGAFINQETRERILDGHVAVWLRADLDVLMQRVRRRSNRPLLRTSDPQETMRRLMQERYPVYAQAHVTVQSYEAPHDAVANSVVAAVLSYLDNQAQESCP